MRLARRCSVGILVPALAAFLSFEQGIFGQNENPAAPKPSAEDTAGFKDFSDRVQQYLQLHRAAESSLPALKTTDLPELIAAHQQALARIIREKRPHAKRGELFSHGAGEAFRHAIRSVFQGPKSKNAQATIRQGEPLKEVHVEVNEVYPDKAPYTTVPPTLLLLLPKLPDELAYRIVGRDLVLMDVKANLVVDLMIEVLPKIS
jgi:hypothetical protein